MKKGSKHSPETCAKMSASGKARAPDSPELLEAKRKGQQKRWAAPGAREKHAQKISERNATPEWKANQSAKQLRRHAEMTEEERQEWRASVGEGRALAWARPEAEPRKKQLSKDFSLAWSLIRGGKVKVPGQAPAKQKDRGGRPLEDEAFARIHELRGQGRSWSQIEQIMNKQKSEDERLTQDAYRKLYGRHVKKLSKVAAAHN